MGGNLCQGRGSTSKKEGESSQTFLTPVEGGESKRKGFASLGLGVKRGFWFQRDEKSLSRGKREIDLP